MSVVLHSKVPGIVLHSCQFILIYPMAYIVKEFNNRQYFIAGWNFEALSASNCGDQKLNFPPKIKIMRKD